MKFSEQWLREWVNPQFGIEDILQQLTMAGLEVDYIEPVAISCFDLVVGEILTVTQHPNAEKLKICQVDVDQSTPLTIVCGAANVHVGMRVPTAVIGARLGKRIIEPSQLRGITSQGMLCSAQELGLTEQSSGIMPLPADAPIGADLRRYLQLDDISITIALTPNRGDCLSIQGIAREVAILTKTPLTPPTWKPIPAKTSNTIPVTVFDPIACPHYVGRLINNVQAQAPIPLWMQERLRRSGLRSVNAIVDVTNYVLLELGQPMHAFDLSRINGGIQVGMATTEEALTLLNGQTITVDEQTLIIADHQQPLALAGIMGGQLAAVNEHTQNIFLESAFFDPKHIANNARYYGLHTDSSHRFERGVDPQLQRQAIEYATALLVDIVGGLPGPIIEITDTTTLPVVYTIPLRADKIKRLLGQTFEPETVTKILTRAGMRVESHDNSWLVQPPSYRCFDITLEADLIEELARIQGYDELPSQAPQSTLIMNAQPRVTLEQLQATLVQRDYQEVITYSFVDPKLQALLTPDCQALALANPIASDLAVMRTTLWSGLLPVLLYNQKRQQLRLRLFETGLQFKPVPNRPLQQEPMLAGIICGTRWPEQWGEKSPPVDFYDLKADVEALLSSLGKRVDTTFQFQPATHAALHPGQTASIYQGEEWIGILGALHPQLIQQLEVIPPVYLFELRLEPLFRQTDPVRSQEISKYPSVRRDLAIVVPESVTASELLTIIKSSATELLLDWKIFDVYRGEGIAPGQKSVAIGLIFQSLSRNLTESEIDTIVGQVVNTLEQKLDAQLRK
jgi:phenylalanyl-tRNA synthetase beta chain